jgi:predicted RecA/RadA family phage recombinase
MTAVTAARRTIQVIPTGSAEYEFVVKTSETIYQGALVALDSSGELVDATETGSEGPYFIATGEMAGDNPATGTARFGVSAAGTLSSAAAGTRIKVRTGLFWLANGESIADSDVGAVAYCDDNATVKTTSTSTSPVGVILAVDSTDGVLVNLYPHDSVVPAGSIDATAIAAGAVDSSELASGGVDPVHLASGWRHLADDAALVIAATDRHVEVTGVAGGTIAATMTATHAGHHIVLRAVAADATHKYTAACSMNAGAGTVTFNAANEYAEFVYDGSAWNCILLSGATFA